MQALQVRSQSRNMSWWRKWHPTYVFLDRKSHGQRCLAGCSWGRKDSDTTQWRNYWGGNPHLEYQPSFRITTFCLLPLLSCLNSFCSPLTTSASVILLAHCFCLGRSQGLGGAGGNRRVGDGGSLEVTPLSPRWCWINPVLHLQVPLVCFRHHSFCNSFILYDRL